MPEPAMEPAPSAGLIERNRRVLGLLTLVVPILIGLLLGALGAPLAVLVAAVLVLVLGFFAASLVVGQRVSRAVRIEREAGYSTLYDLPGFQLRDPRTLELLRPADVAPEQPGSHSLVAGLLRVRPATILAHRIDREQP